MNDLASYAYINARIRAMFSRLLTDAQVDQLIRTKDIQAMFRILKGVACGSHFDDDAGEKTPEEIERQLIRQDIVTHQKILNDLSLGSLSYNLVKLFLERYELHEIKTLLRAWNRGRGDGSRLLVKEAFIRHLDIDRAMAAVDIDAFCTVLADTLYAVPIRRGWEKYKRTNVYFYVESALDRDYFVRLWDCVDQFKGRDWDVASKILGIEVDIENIGALLRLRQHFDLPAHEAVNVMIPRGYRLKSGLMRQALMQKGAEAMARSLAVKPYEDIARVFSSSGEHAGLQLLESGLYRILYRELMNTMSGYPFTIGTVLSFLILKRIETANIITIVYGKQQGLSTEQIRGELLC